MPTFASHPLGRWVSGACVALATAAAQAADAPFAAPQTATHAPVGSAGSLAQVTFSLVLVLAAVFAAAFVVRKLRGFGRFGANHVQVIADVPLGPKEHAVLVQVGTQQLLLGVAPGRVNTLHVLTEPVATTKKEPLSTPAGGPQAPDFKTILRRSLGLK